MVPPIILLFAKSTVVEDYDLMSLHYAVSGAAPLSEDLEIIFSERFKNVQLKQGRESRICMCFKDEFSLICLQNLERLVIV